MADGNPATGPSPLQRAFLALEETRAKLSAHEAAEREPIAIVGMGLRAPGGAHDPESFWRLMLDGVDATGPVPEERWGHSAYFDPDPEVPGRIATRAGGFLQDIDKFDPGFFGIAPREADGMDPQQRMMLTVAWEALENAGQVPAALEGSATGVYLGITGSDYAYLQLKTGDPALLDAHFASGIAHSVLSGRVSYLLGLQGPSLTIDTACSSSLVAVHLASQALRNRECRMAIAGGVNMILAPDIFVALSRARMLAPDGRCKTFSADADGFARAEGCGAVVLKRLSDAQADGDRVIAVIRGSATNQDGPSGSLTAPNGPAQEAVIRSALERAGMAPGDVGYIEAHGTGTELGDPLEVRALGTVFAGERQAPLMIGSVKTNIGHAEGAAGILGLIKAALTVQRGTIPPHLHFSQPSPHIDWNGLGFEVTTTGRAWDGGATPRAAGVSSFGFSGTNAHVIVSEPPTVESIGEDHGRSELFALSARDADALERLARSYADTIATNVDLRLADACRTANAGRSHFAHRTAIRAASREELLAGLQAVAAGGPDAPIVQTASRDAPRVAFLFTGQGSQYPGMAKGLYDSEPVFRAAIDRCQDILGERLGRPLTSLLFEGDGDIDATAHTQPAIFAVEYALATLWQSWGISPNVVIGHSIGEYAAACIAGVFSLEDALLLVEARGRLMQSLPAGGGMAAIFAPENDVASLIATEPDLSIAAINGPLQAAIAGPSEALERACAAAEAKGLKTRMLPVSHAFHSALVEPMLDAFERVAGSVQFSRPRLRLISNLTGKVADPSEITTPGYWRRHVRQTVRFNDGLVALAVAKPGLCIEIGPQPALLAFAAAAFDGGATTMLASLRKGVDDRAQMLDSLAAAYRAGAQVNWPAVTPRGRIASLPSYPFDLQRFWFKANPAVRLSHTTRGALPLLGTRLRSPGPETVFEAAIGADSPAFVRDHRVQDRIILPAAAFLEMLVSGGRAVAGGAPVTVENVTIDDALALDDDGTPCWVQSRFAPVLEGWDVRIASSDDEGTAWHHHVTARVVRDRTPAAGPSLDTVRASAPDAVDLNRFYAEFAALGLDFGARFRPLRQVWSGEGQAVGEIATGETASDYAIHPALLDGCLQVMAAALFAEDGPNALHLPVGIGAFTLTGDAGSRCWAHARVDAPGGLVRRAEITIFGESGEVIASLRDIQLRRVEAGALQRQEMRWLEDALYEVDWAPAAEAAAADFQPDALTQEAQTALADLQRETRIADYDVGIARLEDLCGEYVVRAMHRLGWAPQPGDMVEDSELAGRLGVVPRHQRLFGRLLAILAEMDLLEPLSDGWRVLAPLPHVDPVTEAARLAAEAPLVEAELELTARVANEFAEALRGERDEAELLFPGGSMETAERLYRESPTARLFNGLIARLMQAAAAAHAEGRPLRILEVGGGTGGTTAHVAPLLPADVEYCFTDVGPSFVAKARDRFAEFGFLTFATFDLEKDAADQGISEQHFDVILASNVIHATADLRRTLGKLRALLVPGGLLTMLEVTERLRWFDLTVGLTEGWWAFTDSDLRKDYPTLQREEWIELLGTCGFDTVSPLPQIEQGAGSISRQSVLVARADSARPAKSWLILDDAGGTARALAERLTAEGDRCLIASDLGTIRGDSAEDHRVLIEEAVQRGVHWVIHARSLDAGEDDLDGAMADGVLSAMLTAQALVAHEPCPRLILLTHRAQQVNVSEAPPVPEQAPTIGLARSLVAEHPELRLSCIDVDAVEPEMLAAEVCRNGDDGEIALRPDGRFAPRLVRATIPPAQALTADAPWRLVPAQRGSLDSFQRQPFTPAEPGAGEVLIAVEATGMNFKDVLNALDLYPGDPGPLGAECAGRVLAVGADVTDYGPGDRVMAAIGGSFASHATAKVELVAPLADTIPFEEGASLPIAFLTAAFCLEHLAGLQRSDVVLIHAATGGVGMAAVQIAQNAGATVIATAGTPEKRALLHRKGVEHVFDSRSDGFAADVLAVTGGRGADVVLNSLGGELVEPSFTAIADGGRFIEIGKRGIKSPEWVSALDREIDYHIVDWGVTAEEQPELIGGILRDLSRRFAAGNLTALPRHVFPMDDAARAFRFMAQARHIGRIVLRHRSDAAGRIRSDGTYVITGGLSGLGLAFARHLAEQGAGRLALIGRRGITDEARPVLAEIAELGTDLVTRSMDVSDETAMAALLDELRSGGPPIRGVIHSAGSLANAGLLQQDADRFRHVFASKVTGTALLDSLTRGDPIEMFVLFSSIASVLGSPGQSNHSAANAYMDVLARQRRANGLPGLSINWGAWSEIGAAAEIAAPLASRGLAAISPAQGLTAFDVLAWGQTAQIAVLRMDWAQFLGNAGTCKARFLSALSSPVARKIDNVAAAQQADILEDLRATPEPRRRARMATFVREKALRTLGMNEATPLDPTMPFGELGLDSLLSVELRNALGSALGRSFPATLLFDYPTVNELSEHLLNEFFPDNGPKAQEVRKNQTKDDMIDTVSELSDEAILEMLASLSDDRGAA